MNVLVVDLARVLDASALGLKASEELAADFHAAKEKADGLRAQAKAATGALQKTVTDELQTFERDSLKALDDKKLALRERVLAAARTVIESIREERKATLVLDANAVVLAAEASDITEEVIARVDGA